MFDLCSLCTNQFCLCFFPENAEHCPWAASAEADVMRFPRRDDKDQQLSCKFISSVLYICCVFNFMLCVTPPSPFQPPTSPPSPSFFSCVHGWILFELLLSICTKYICRCFLRRMQGSALCSVSKRREAVFLRRDDEEQQLLGKCVLPYLISSFLIICCVWPPFIFPCPWSPSPSNPSPFHRTSFLVSCAWMNNVWFM